MEFVMQHASHLSTAGIVYVYLRAAAPIDPLTGAAVAFGAAFVSDMFFGKG